MRSAAARLAWRDSAWVDAACRPSRFRAPVVPGDTVTTSGRVTNVRRAGAHLLYSAAVQATKQDGTVVALGDAMGRVPVPPSWENPIS